MNPNIRYQEQYQNSTSFKFSYDQQKQSDRNKNVPKEQGEDLSKYSFQSRNQQIIANQPILTKHKSNNADMRLYQESNFTKSYRLDSNANPSFNAQQNNQYKTTTNFYRPAELHKSESANDFFDNVAAQSTKNQQFFIKQKVSYSQSIRQSEPFKQNTNKMILKNKLERDEENRTYKFQTGSQQECQKCEEIQKQNERIMTFMREQLEIGVKQFSDRMNKIIIEQAKEIKDLRRYLLNNEKNLISLQNQSNNQQYPINQRALSPARGPIRQKSPSKLSLTKSNTSISQNHGGKQKITMVSKQLSPSKSTIQQRNLQKQNSSMQRMTSTVQQSHQTVLTSEEISRKIKALEQKIQLSCKLEHQKNQKAFFMNKKIEQLQKGVMSLFASKITRANQILNAWISKEEYKVSQLYKQMKVISIKVGSMSGNSSNSSIKPVHPTNLKVSQNSCYSSPSITYPQNSRSEQSIDSINLNKISIKLKHFCSEIQDLKEIALNLQTKEFKYDNFQIDNLMKSIEEIQFNIYHLQKNRQEISTKIKSNEQRLEQEFQMSKISQLQSKTQINPSQKDYNKNRMKNISINRNNSVELSYSDKNYNLYEMGARSMKHQTNLNECSKLTKNTKITSNNYSNFQPHSHSQFKGFAGEQSGFSQYVEESVYNNINSHQNQNRYQEQEEYQNYEQSFSRSSQQEGSQDYEEEEAQEMFYHVDLSTNNDRMIREKKLSQQNREYPLTGSQKAFPSPTIQRLMEVINLRQKLPLRIEIDQTGYIKSADNGTYIVDKKSDGFDLNKNQLEWLKQKGIIILEGHC